MFFFKLYAPGDTIALIDLDDHIHISTSTRIFARKSVVILLYQTTIVAKHAPYSLGITLPIEIGVLECVEDLVRDFIQLTEKHDQYDVGLITVLGSTSEFLTGVSCLYSGIGVNS